MLREQPGLHVRRASDNGVADAANVPKSAWMDDGRAGAMDRVAVLSPAVQLSDPAKLPARVFDCDGAPVDWFFVDESGMSGA